MCHYDTHALQLKKNINECLNLLSLLCTFSCKILTFNNSQRYNFSKNGKTRILEIFNQDKTGTNDYSILKITCDTLSEVESELDGQLSDGIFENFRVGRIDEVQ